MEGRFSAGRVGLRNAYSPVTPLESLDQRFSQLPPSVPSKAKTKIEDDCRSLSPDLAKMYRSNVSELSKTDQGKRFLELPELLACDASIRRPIINNTYYMEPHHLEKLIHIMGVNARSQEAAQKFNTLIERPAFFLEYIDTMAKAWDHATKLDAPQDFKQNHNDYLKNHDWEKGRQAFMLKIQEKDLQRMGSQSLPKTERERITSNLLNDATLRKAVQTNHSARKNFRSNDKTWLPQEDGSVSGWPHFSVESGITVLALPHETHVLANALFDPAAQAFMQSGDKHWEFHFSRGQFQHATSRTPPARNTR